MLDAGLAEIRRVEIDAPTTVLIGRRSQIPAAFQAQADYVPR